MAQHTYNTAYMTQLINLEDILMDTDHSHRYDFYTNWNNTINTNRIKDYKYNINSRLFYAYGISMEPYLYTNNVFKYDPKLFNFIGEYEGEILGYLYSHHFATNIDDLLSVYNIWKDKDIYIGYKDNYNDDDLQFINNKQWWIAYDRMLHNHFYHLMGYSYIYKDYNSKDIDEEHLKHLNYKNDSYWNTKPYYVDVNNAKFEPSLSSKEEKEVYENMEEAIIRDSYLPNVMIGCPNLVEYFPLLTKPLPIKHFYKEGESDTIQEYPISVDALYNSEISVKENKYIYYDEINTLNLYDVVYTDKSRRNILIMNYIPNEIENMEYYTFAHNEKPRILLNHGNRHLIYKTTMKKLFSNDSLFPDFVAVIRDYKKDTLINKSEDKYSLNASSLFDDATYRKILKRIDDICADYWKNPKEIYRRCRDIVDEAYSHVVKVYRLNKKTIKEYIKTNLLKKNIWENEDTPITLEIAFVKDNDYESKDNADKAVYAGALNIFITTPNINHYLIFSARIKDTNTGELSCTTYTPDNNTFLKVIDKRRSYVYITGTAPNYVIKYSNKIPDGFKALQNEIRYQNCIVCVPDIPIGKDSPVHPDSTNKNNPLWYWYDMDNDGIINGKDISKSYEYIYLPIKNNKGETHLDDAILCTKEEIPDNYIVSTHVLRDLEVPPTVKVKYTTWPNVGNKINYPLKVLLPKYMDGQSHLYDDPNYPWNKWLKEIDTGTITFIFDENIRCSFKFNPNNKFGEILEKNKQELDAKATMYYEKHPEVKTIIGWSLNTTAEKHTALSNTDRFKNNTVNLYTVLEFKLSKEDIKGVLKWVQHKVTKLWYPIKLVKKIIWTVNNNPNDPRYYLSKLNPDDAEKIVSDNDGWNHDKTENGKTLLRSFTKEYTNIKQCIEFYDGTVLEQTNHSIVKPYVDYIKDLFNKLSDKKIDKMDFVDSNYMFVKEYINGDTGNSELYLNLAGFYHNCIFNLKNIYNSNYITSQERFNSRLYYNLYFKDYNKKIQELVEESEKGYNNFPVKLIYNPTSLDVTVHRIYDIYTYTHFAIDTTVGYDLDGDEPRPQPEPTPTPGVTPKPTPKPVPAPDSKPEPIPKPQSVPVPDHENKVITQKDVEDHFFDTKEEFIAEIKSLKENKVSTVKLKFNNKVYTMGLVKDFEALVKTYGHLDSNIYKKIIFYNGHSQYTTHVNATCAYNNDSSSKKYQICNASWLDGTEDLFKGLPYFDSYLKRYEKKYYYNLEFKAGLSYISDSYAKEFLEEGSFTKEFLDFQDKWIHGFTRYITEETYELTSEMGGVLNSMKAKFKIDGTETLGGIDENEVGYLLYPLIQPGANKYKD